MNNMKLVSFSLALLAAASLLSACGGGGGGGSGSPAASPQAAPQSLTPTSLEGRWQTSAGSSSAQTAIVLPTSVGGSAMSAWLLSSDLSTLSKTAVNTSGADGVTLQGKSYALGSASPAQAVTYSGTANVSSSTLSLNSGSLSFTLTDGLAGTSKVSEVQGAWTATFGGGALKVDWSVAADGGVSGTGSTGCSYGGKLTGRNDVKAFVAELTETCSGVAKSFAGVATYRPAQGVTPAGLTLALVSSDEASALVVALQK